MTPKSKVTVFGAGGFIGRAMVRHYRAIGFEVAAVGRRDWPPPGSDLGMAIYAIGLTPAFRDRPVEMVASHVTVLAEILQAYTFQSFLYMSSTRGYRGAATTSEEAPWCLSPVDSDCLYDIAKLAGEALCLSLGPKVRIARLSSVYGSYQGPKTFLPSLVHDVRATGAVTIRLGPSSAKDYVHVDDACAALAHIAAEGRHRIYNVASGANTSNAEIAELLTSKLHASVRFAPNAPTVQLLQIDVSRLAAEFPWRPRPLARGFMDAFVTDGGEDGH